MLDVPPVTEPPANEHPTTTALVEIGEPVVLYAPTTVVAAPELAYTGAETPLMLGIGAVLTLIGCALLGLRRAV